MSVFNYIISLEITSGAQAKSQMCNFCKALKSYENRGGIDSLDFKIMRGLGPSAEEILQRNLNTGLNNSVLRKFYFNTNLRN